MPVDRALVDAGPLGDARTVSARQSQIDEPCSELGAGGDDALARLRPPARGGAGCRTPAAAAARRRRHGTTTGSVSQPRTVEVGESLARVAVDLPLGEPLEHLFERDAPFEAGERGAEAEVDAEAEREVLADLAVDVEPVAVRVAPVVAVRRADEEQHDAAFGHRLAVELHVARRRTRPTCGAGRLEAQQLLDRVRDERRILDELAPLVGVLGQHLAGPADQARASSRCRRRRSTVT